MKKIFRLASVLALAGVALMYTGCTKDYDADIKAIKTDLADLQSGTITNQSQQIAALQAQAASLQTIAGQFQQTLEGLQAAKADKTAVAADKAELLKKISEMEVSISKQISEINAALVTVNSVLDTKANKSWVEQTFATKDALATVMSSLGSVEGRVAVIENNLSTLGVDLQGVENKLTKVSETATKAAADASTALGEIAALKESLLAYYKKGEVEALVNEAVLKLQDEIAAIDESKEDKEEAAKTKADLLAKIKNLQQTLQPFMKATDSRFDEMNLALTALTAKVDGIDKSYKAADIALENAYKAADSIINKKLDEQKAALEAEIKALKEALATETAAREASIDAEAEARANADTTEMNARISAINQEIANREAAIKEAIDGEIAARNEAINKAIEDETAARNEAIKEAIEIEENARKNAINEANAARAKGDSILAKSIEDEITARQKAIKELQDLLEGKIADLDTAVKGLSQDLKDEITARQKAIKELQDLLEGKIADLDTAVKGLSQDLKDEITNREKAVKDLETKLAAEIKVCKDSIQIIEIALAQEVKDRGLSEDTIKASIRQEIKDRQDAIQYVIDSLNNAINTEVANRNKRVEDEAALLRSEIQAVQDSLDNACIAIKNNKASIDEEIQNRIDAINKLTSALADSISGLRSELTTNVLGLSNRIKSVSVYPTKNPELVRYVVGNDSSLVLITTFQVKPASAAQKFLNNPELLKLSYGYATERGVKNTRAAISLTNYKDVEVEVGSKADLDLGLIKIKAVKLKEDSQNILDAQSASQMFFALEITDEDTVGTYKIMSEYQNPVYGKSYNLNAEFTASGYSVNAKHQEYTKSDIDYTLCKDTVIKSVFPKAKILVEYTRPGEVSKIVTIEDFQKFSGMTFNVSDTVYIRTKHATALPADSCIVLKKDANQALKTRARFKNNTSEATFKLYVGEIDTVVYHPNINGIDVDVEFRHAFEIIKHIKAEVTKNFRVYWNYINYDSDNYGRSKDTLKYDTLIVNEPTTKTSLDWWSYCIKQNAWYEGGNNNDKTQPLKLQGKSTFMFWDYSAQDPKAYYGNLYVAYARFQSKAQHYEDVLKKEDTYNRYNFNISVDIDSIPVIAEETFTKADSIGVTVTKTNTVKFSKAIVGEPFIGNKDAVKPYLIAGLDSYDFNAISNKFFMNGNFVVDKVVRLKPTTHSTKPYDTLVIDNAKLAISADNSDVKLAFDKMTLMPNSKYIVNAHKTVFGLDYKMVFVFETKKSSIVLVTTSYIKTAAETDALRSSTSDKEIFAGTMGAEAKGRINPTTAYNENQYESYYSLEDNAIQQYLRAEQAYKLSTEEDYSQYSVSYQYEMAQAAGTTLLPVIPDSSKITKQANKTEMLLSALNSTKPKQDIKWNKYTGRVLKITAILWVNDEAVDSKTFILWTKTPVILKAVSNVNTPIKKAGESLPVFLNKYVSVNGLVEGLEVEKNVYDVTGTNKLLYQKYFSRNDGYSTDHSKFFTYSIDETKVTFDGKPYDFRSGNDYSFDPTTTELTIFKNNVIGELIIPIKVSMKYYLDYNHNTSYSYGVQTKDIEVKIKVTE